MFKAIIVIVLIVVTVRTCSSEDKKRTIETTKETGTFLGRMGDSFMEGYNEQKAKSKNRTPEAIMRSMSKQVLDQYKAEDKIIRKMRIREDSLTRVKLKRYNIED